MFHFGHRWEYWFDRQYATVNFHSWHCENLAIAKELAGLCSMKGRTTWKEIADKVIKCANEKLGLTFDNLVAVCIYGTPSFFIHTTCPFQNSGLIRVTMNN
jgi:hypothetical protein